MICIPVRKKTFRSIFEQFCLAQKKADLIELWLDEVNLKDKQLDDLFKSKKHPVIYKCTNVENIDRHMVYKIDYIDLDFQTPKKIIKGLKNNHPNVKLILSFHDFDKTPSTQKLMKIVSKMKKSGADIVKLATTAENFSDSLRMLSILSNLTKEGVQSICLCMGKEGKITRLAGHLLGNYLMFAPLTQADKTAGGQINFQELKSIMKLTK